MQEYKKSEISRIQDKIERIDARSYKLKDEKAHPPQVETSDLGFAKERKRLLVLPLDVKSPKETVTKCLKSENFNKQLTFRNQTLAMNQQKEGSKTPMH